MNTAHLPILIATALAGALTITNARAQTPDSLKTRMGKLSFENGYPSEETARKLFDELDYQRAVQAYLWAYPAVSFESIRIATNRDLGADLNDLVIADNYADPKGLWLTANDTTSTRWPTLTLGSRDRSSSRSRPERSSD